jgi:hypothetical protein
VNRDGKTSQEIECNLKAKLASLKLGVTQGSILDQGQELSGLLRIAEWVGKEPAQQIDAVAQRLLAECGTAE